MKDKRRAEQNERVKLKEAEAKKGRSRGGDDNSTDEECKKTYTKKLISNVWYLGCEFGLKLAGERLLCRWLIE